MLIYFLVALFCAFVVYKYYLQSQLGPVKKIMVPFNVIPVVILLLILAYQIYRVRENLDWIQMTVLIIMFITSGLYMIRYNLAIREKGIVVDSKPITYDQIRYYTSEHRYIIVYYEIKGKMRNKMIPSFYSNDQKIKAALIAQNIPMEK